MAVQPFCLLWVLLHRCRTSFRSYSHKLILFHILSRSRKSRKRSKSVIFISLHSFRRDGLMASVTSFVYLFRGYITLTSLLFVLKRQRNTVQLVLDTGCVLKPSQVSTDVPISCEVVQRLSSCVIHGIN